MFRKIIPLTALALIVGLGANAQSKTEKAEKTPAKVEKQETLAPYSDKEEAAHRQRIEAFEEKINANKNNDNVDIDAEMARLKEMKERFNKRAKTKIE